MGLDWNPANKAVPGREADYEALKAALDAELADESQHDADDEQESEASRRFFEASISAFDTLMAPTVGVDEPANQWAREEFAQLETDEPFEKWFESIRGLRLAHLSPCPGVPRYSNGSVGGYVEPFSFRGQFLTFCEPIIGMEVLERCYQNMPAEELISFGQHLKEKGEALVRESGLILPKESDEFDEEDPRWHADILIAAGDWCIFWGERGHPLEAYW